MFSVLSICHSVQGMRGPYVTTACDAIGQSVSQTCSLGDLPPSPSPGLPFGPFKLVHYVRQRSVG